MRFPVFFKQLRDLWREKTFLLVIGLILFVMLSLSLLIAVTAFVYNPEFLADEPVKVAYVGTEDITSYNAKIQWGLFPDMDTALEAFYDGTVDGVVHQQPGDLLLFDVVLPNNPVKKSLLSALLKDTFQKLEDAVLSQQEILPMISPADIRTQNVPIRGLDKIYEILFGFALPLFLLIPLFLIGNLFVDNISEDFERKNNALLFSSYNPLRYIHQTLAFGAVINVILVLAIQLVMFKRFSFLTNEWIVFGYVLLFFGIIAQLAILFAFIFKTKTPAQLSYSFSVLTIFLFSPYVMHFPIKTISISMLGIDAFNPVYVAWTLLANVLLYVVLRWYVAREYYV